jgi:hypothetical protein
MSALDDCVLCPNKADPRWQLMTRDGDVYALCDGCAPWSGEETAVSDKCRASGKPPLQSYGRFGINEPKEKAQP